MKKVLIIGASGMIGHQMWMMAQKYYNAFAFIRKSKSHYDNWNLFNSKNVIDGVNVTDFSLVESKLIKIKPDVVINCTGITIRKKEIQDLNYTLNVNSLFPQKLAKWCQNQGVRLIHFSTDCVFSGKKGYYAESDIPDATDHYGTTKFLGEVIGDKILTLRIPVIGRELEGKTELLEWVLRQKNQKIKGYSRALYSGMTVHQASKEIYKLIESTTILGGLYHISTPPISKYDLIHKINQIYKLNIQIDKEDTHITNKVLISEKYQQITGFSAPSWEIMLEEALAENDLTY